MDRVDTIVDTPMDTLVWTPREEGFLLWRENQKNDGSEICEKCI